ncbi:hypothetical protein ID855_20295 [Xenorhabdus sp. ZM]|uniref:hypothetical protein n=1 Tax=Xenorhabdus szentirmaii TaxID=290112 RepID=UPI0019CD9F47|nr:hypothetical protein [Xenorhabdus sp. ZM]MBD2806963.1 hypothetical protein [Xenorhabdus sp. ZM]
MSLSEHERVMLERTLFKVNKKHTQFLFKAISTASDFAKSINIDITNHHISFEKTCHQENKQELYLVDFYAMDLIPDKSIDWLVVFPDDFNWISVEIDVKTGDVISVYRKQ